MKQVSNNNIDTGRRDPRRNVSSLSRAISSAPPLPLYLSSVRSFFLFIQQDFHFSPPNAFTLFPVASVEDCKLLLSGACFISIIICSAFELSSECGQGARTMQRKLIIIISARYFHWNNSYSRTVVFANARLAAPFCWPEHPFLLARPPSLPRHSLTPWVFTIRSPALRSVEALFSFLANDCVKYHWASAF